MKILVTGFTPFDNHERNPSLDILHSLPDVLDVAEIIKQPLPTEFERGAQLVTSAIDKHQPEFVLNIGQSDGRSGITPELVAVNLDDARMPDNIGAQPKNQVIHADGETEYFSNLPIKTIVRNIRDLGLASFISTSAGSYVCNHVMYEVQYLMHKKYPNMKSGFIHVPSNYSDNDSTPTMALDDEVDGIKIALLTMLYHLDDNITLDHPYD
ncbi:pyroglutamyl-peptidase I (plasmid) [Nicoliella spurrieriana]|uniref:Pyroglutamyl-peptidase I n=1 Tax=Nicoliella spurrieriana TaxID=2925830 RepID=A0A976RQS9_9LACO|nr:pyroglutamyl-peptidase I [Nicoliella spurrieriana]UQS86133.1 pyroglutamyl-peptidase I [Nicoliella spurrieriana]